VREEPTAADEVPGCVQLEEERLTEAQRTEAAPAPRLSEVGFVDARAVAEKPEPVPVGHGNKGPHSQDLSSSRGGTAPCAAGGLDKDPNPPCERSTGIMYLQCALIQVHVKPACLSTTW